MAKQATKKTNVDAATDLMYSLVERTTKAVDATMNRADAAGDNDISAMFSAVTVISSALEAYVAESKTIKEKLDKSLSLAQMVQFNKEVEEVEKKGKAYLSSLPPAARDGIQEYESIKNSNALTEREKRMYMAWVVDKEIKAAIPEIQREIGSMAPLLALGSLLSGLAGEDSKEPAPVGLRKDDKTK